MPNSGSCSNGTCMSRYGTVRRRRRRTPDQASSPLLSCAAASGMRGRTAPSILLLALPPHPAAAIALFRSRLAGAGAVHGATTTPQRPLAAKCSALVQYRTVSAMCTRSRHLSHPCCCHRLPSTPYRSRITSLAAVWTSHTRAYQEFQVNLPSRCWNHFHAPFTSPTRFVSCSPRSNACCLRLLADELAPTPSSTLLSSRISHWARRSDGSLRECAATVECVDASPRSTSRPAHTTTAAANMQATALSVNEALRC